MSWTTKRSIDHQKMYTYQVTFVINTNFNISTHVLLWLIDRLFLEHVGLPHVLDLAVHLEILGGRWVKRIILSHF